jgi:hypothetical protein
MIASTPIDAFSDGCWISTTFSPLPLQPPACFINCNALWTKFELRLPSRTQIEHKALRESTSVCSEASNLCGIQVIHLP